MKSFERLEILRAAVSVVGVDGEIHEGEKALIEKLAGEIGVGLASRTAMLDRAQNDPEFHQQMLRVLKTEPEQTMAILLNAAMADGELAESEVKVLKHFATKLEFEEARLEALIDDAVKR
ncbi:MAG: hypothetical protein VX438_19425 [Planctomycetota bacterium]|jgi:uncharacterized tellurite resistance protein B-like protein|nr:hypothetical protein [Planctomycetota bacterium]